MSECIIVRVHSRHHADMQTQSHPPCASASVVCTQQQAEQCRAVQSSVVAVTLVAKKGAEVSSFCTKAHSTTSFSPAMAAMRREAKN